MKRTPLRKVSKKRAKINRERQRLVEQELGERTSCEAGATIYLNTGVACCRARATELHEPLMRSRGGSSLDPENTIAICRGCHRWIHDHPETATELGLLESQHGGTV